MARSKLAKVWEFRAPAPQSNLAEREEASLAKPPKRDHPEVKSPKDSEATADLRTRIVTAALKHFDRFASLEPKVLRGDDPKAIHDIRVATRRLQTAMDLLVLKPRPAGIRKVRRRLRRCRRILSEVRNCDVMIARADSALARKRTAHREAWAAFREYLGERRSKAFSKAVRKMGKASLAFSRLQLKHTLERATQAPLRQEDEPKRHDGEIEARHSFQSEVVTRTEDARKSFEKRLEACLADPNSQASHQLRIAAKRLRYLVEILREFEITGASEALVWFRAIQKHLGDLHDTDVLEQMMIEMIAKPEYLKEHLDLAFQVARLVLKIRRKKRLLAGRFVRVAANSAEYRRIQDLLAALPESLSAETASA